MKYIIATFLSFLLALLHLQVMAQSDLKKADKLFYDMDYALAVTEYKKVLSEGEPSLYVTQKIADAYRLMNNIKEAEFWYAQVLNFPNHNVGSILHYAEAAKQNGNYDKAKQLFQMYAEKVPSEAEAVKLQIAGCDKAKFWMSNPMSAKVRKEVILSSDAADFSPVFLEDKLIFASDRPKAAEESTYGWTGNSYVQLYESVRKGDAWEEPKPLDAAINTAFHNGPADFLPDRSTVIFTRTNYVKKRQKEINADPTSWVKKKPKYLNVNRLELYTAQKTEAGWSNVQPFAYNNVDEYSVGHPAVSPDGSLLYFVSDMPGGMGATDIYFSEKQADGSWGKPVNAGKTINTTGREMFPSFDRNGTLYFASDGHIGMGGLDIFRATGSRTEWQYIENMAHPINSSRDDFGIVFDKNQDTGYLSSNRYSDNGTDDILSFEVVRIPCVVVGRTYERIAQKNRTQYKESAVPEVRLKLYRVGDTTALEMYSDKKGRFFFNIQAGIHYEIKGSKEGYLTNTVTFVPECKTNTDSVKVEMVFNRKVLNQPVVIENIYYDLDKYDIREDAKPELNKIVRMLKDNPDIKIELSSHTDSRQTHGYNQMLSQLRAEAAVRYIVENGIDLDRIIAKATAKRSS
ncbi:MAG: OmpA family protein [Hymenobacteraceae bacterium]|nr:OmpA family protein [Hymenobacteraceae bacterium]MDX5397968.1 OmpA family protein [Hymenobacteraceae bacterium]MDX5514040.1 OmpA family protein [Hymenobacteraceae bacterium]